MINLRDLLPMGFRFIFLLNGKVVFFFKLFTYSDVDVSFAMIINAILHAVSSKSNNFVIARIEEN